MSDDEDTKDDEKIPLKDLDLNVVRVLPKIGEVVPLYGYITEILSENPLTIMINYSIKGKCIINDPDKVAIIKNRMLEPGIFIAEIEQLLPDNTYVATIGTIVFGKKKEFDA